ncbi:carbohydrate ABC transporter permease [Paenibacillus sp. R14(2021)]|uniref:carbohydrate ABC transporter permease n=1 Tax=Paenibacillus sp. R14(2021) TaxID=2859228 RepID=UPI001C614D89|nr:carbohydrate ABC transporter permease [Paenibacillus sp. R14(2021)]
MLHEERTLGNQLFNVMNIIAFTLFTLACIFPFYYIFINTISDNKLASTGQILLLPKGTHFHNYVEVFKIKGLWNAAFISVARTVLGTLLTLVGSAFLGYAFCRGEYWKRTFWYRFVIVTMYFNAGLIPWFVTMKNLGMLNNFLAYILPGLVSPFFVILFKTYVEQIPPALEESAQLDGAGYMVRFTRVVLPLSMPILATIGVFASVGQWNAFMDTLFLMRDAKLYTLQFVLYQHLSEVNALAALMRSSSSGQPIDPSRLLTATSIRMTISIVVVLPILCVYPFLQRFFVKGIMIGAVKG